MAYDYQEGQQEISGRQIDQQLKQINFHKHEEKIE